MATHPAISPADLRTSLATLRHQAHAVASSDAWVAWGLALAMVARKTIFLRQRGVDEYLSVDIYAAAEIALVSLSWLFILTRPYIHAAASDIRNTSAAWIFGFYCLGIVSAVWSEHVAYSGMLAAEVVSQVVLIYIGFAGCRDFAQAERRLLTIAMLAIVLGMGVSVKFYGFSLQLKDWHTNHYSASAAMVSCYCFGEYLRAGMQRRKWLLCIGLISLAALLLGTSAASMLAGFAGLCVATILLRSSVWPLLLLTIVVFGAWLAPDRAFEAFFPHKTETQIRSLHGRLVYWQQAMEFITERPILGHGFAIGPRLGAIRSTNMHNSIMSILLGMGCVGLGVAILGTMRLLVELWTSTRWKKVGSVGCACGLAAGVVNSMTISFLGEGWRAPTLVFVSLLYLHTTSLNTRIRFPAPARKLARVAAR